VKLEPQILVDDTSCDLRGVILKQRDMKNAETDFQLGRSIMTLHLTLEQRHVLPISTYWSIYTINMELSVDAVLDFLSSLIALAAKQLHRREQNGRLSTTGDEIFAAHRYHHNNIQ
jgi:hypothetical protein